MSTSKKIIDNILFFLCLKDVHYCSYGHAHATTVAAKDCEAYYNAKCKSCGHRLHESPRSAYGKL